jgi:hypothetical protein
VKEKLGDMEPEIGPPKSESNRGGLLSFVKAYERVDRLSGKLGSNE